MCSLQQETKNRCYFDALIKKLDEQRKWSQRMEKKTLFTCVLHESKHVFFSLIINRPYLGFATPKSVKQIVWLGWINLGHHISARLFPIKLHSFSIGRKLVLVQASITFSILKQDFLVILKRRRHFAASRSV